VDVTSLLNSSTSRLGPAAAARNVALELDIEEFGICAGDADQLARAIANVVSNAIKFTPPEGWVRVVARRSGDQVEIVISDNGIGIPREEQSKLFTRFFRASVAIDQAHSGTGLGLTITKAIVEHHGGNISIDSALGAGTRVSITLPLIAVGSLTDGISA
jgi:signal transduction histidine kinase